MVAGGPQAARPTCTFRCWYMCAHPLLNRHTPARIHTARPPTCGQFIGPTLATSCQVAPPSSEATTTFCRVSSPLPQLQDLFKWLGSCWGGGLVW